MTPARPKDELTRIAAELAHLPAAQRAERWLALDEETAADAFDLLHPWEQRELLEELGEDEVARLLEEMEPDDRVELLRHMPAEDADRALSGLSSAERRLTYALLAHPPRSAGRIMSPEFLALRPEETVAAALEQVREHGAGLETLLLLPVVDREGRLAGAVPLTELVCADPERPVAEVTDELYPAVDPDTDQERVARLMHEHDLVAVPVVDAERRPLGIVTVDDAIEVLEHEHTEDIHRAGGASEPLGIPYRAASVGRLVRARIGWLLFLVATGAVTVSVLDAFEATLGKVVTLTLFVPVLIGTGGNCGSQAATTMTRALAVGDVTLRDVVPAVLKETRVGLLLGLLFAALGLPVITALWSLDIAATVSLSLLAICTWATTVGAALPMLSQRLGVDPAVVSAPVVSSLVDATGLVIYLAIARAIVL